MMSGHFQYEIREEGVHLEYVQKKVLGGISTVPVSDWLTVATKGQRQGVSAILNLDEGTDSILNQDFCLISHDDVAGFSEAEALSLNLPPIVTLGLSITTSGDLGRDLSIGHHWVRSSGQGEIVSNVVGSLLQYGNSWYRMPEQVFSVYKTLLDLKLAKDETGALNQEHLLMLKACFPEQSSDVVEQDEYLKQIRIYSAAAFSLDMTVRDGQVDINPTLFSRIAKEKNEDGIIISDAEALLPPHLQDVFANDRFLRGTEECTHFVLEGGAYLFVDPGLRPVLREIRKIKTSGDQDQIRALVRNPQSILSELVSEQDGEDTLDALFVETEQYSDRVEGVGIWTKISLPYLSPESSSEWLPEQFPLQIGQEIVFAKQDEIEELYEEVKVAVREGESFLQFKGKEIPANKSTEKLLGEMVNILIPAVNESREKEEGQKESSVHNSFLLVKENYDELQTRIEDKVRRRESNDPADLPHSLLSQPKTYQSKGFDWLVESWSSGASGALLADDMGLGKTFQTLSFLIWWIEQNWVECHNPILIVAPTGLLANWEEEFGIHVAEPAIPEVQRLFGVELRAHKIVDQKGSDTKTGSVTLDVDSLSKSRVILTTYETLRDYHLSLGKIRFGLVVYDEIQKLKNPTSQMSKAAKCVNADFSIALTGTPIENSLTDIWAIIDVVSPGLLGSLREFSEKYRSSDIESLRSLTAFMYGRQNSRPAPMLRRMKSSELEGLPSKTTLRKKALMPPEQSRAFLDIIAAAKSDDPPPILQTLHRLRGASLHPSSPDRAWEIGEDKFVAQSSRLASTIELLEEIRAQNEKALVFVENLEMQKFLACYLKTKFDMKKMPMRINGSIKGAKRQEYVNEFQLHKNVGFDVMLISPKAGGVGLNLTAASHVIHLSRWWNPAIEDQCTDRAYRIGQTKPVKVHIPLAVHPDPVLGPNSFDLKLDELLDRKRSMSLDVLQCTENGDEARELVDGVCGMAAESDPRSNVSLEDIDRLEPVSGFEEWVHDLAKMDGWALRNTPWSGDHGADGVIEKDGVVAILQCKHVQDGGVIGDKYVDDLLEARTKYQLDDPILVGLTNARDISAKAEERASRYGIETVKRNRILSWSRGII